MQHVPQQLAAAPAQKHHVGSTTGCDSLVATCEQSKLAPAAAGRLGVASRKHNTCVCCPACSACCNQPHKERPWRRYDQDAESTATRWVPASAAPLHLLNSSGVSFR